MATAYTVLGVAPDATQEQIAEAFRARCAECHPDRATSDDDRAARTAKIAKITLAKRYLDDPETRAKYDRKLADLAAKTAGAAPQASASADTVTVDDFLCRIRSAGNPGDVVADYAREMCIADQAGVERIRAASAKGAEIAKGVVDLIGLVRGYQR